MKDAPARFELLASHTGQPVALGAVLEVRAVVVEHARHLGFELSPRDELRLGSPVVVVLENDVARHDLSLRAEVADGLDILAPDQTSAGVILDLPPTVDVRALRTVVGEDDDF